METLSYKLDKKIIYATTFCVSVILFLFGAALKADAATVYLSPATGSIQPGGTLDVDIRVNPSPGETRNVIFTIGFDTNLVDESTSSYSLSGSALPGSFFLPETAITEGSVISAQFVALTPGGPGPALIGDSLVGKLRFKSSGIAGQLNLTLLTTGDYPTSVGNAACKDIDCEQVLPLTIGNGSYTIVAPPNPPGEPPTTPPPPPISSTPPPSKKTPNTSPPAETPPSSSETTTTAADTKIPELSNIKVTVVSDTEAIVEWETDEDAVSYLEYGFTEDYSKSEASIKNTRSHKLTLKNLVPSTRYNFRVMSADPFGNTAYSDNETFTTKPPVAVQQTYRMIGLAMIIGGLLALGIIAFFYFRKKGPHPDNLVPQTPDGVNLNPPI